MDLVARKSKSVDEFNDFDDDNEDYPVDQEYDHYEVTITLRVRSTNIDLVQDIISDLFSEIMDTAESSYKKEIKIEDYDITTEPAEL